MKKKYTICVFFLFVTGLLAAPVISLDKHSVYFGTYPANEEKHATFTITNDGNHTLKILKVTRSCGCSTTRLEKDALEPGESTPLHLTIAKEYLEGDYKKTVTLESNDPKKRFTVIKITGNSVPLVKVSPKKKYYLGRVNQAAFYTKEFTLETDSEVEFGQPQINGFKAQVNVTRENPDNDLQRTVKHDVTVSLTAPTIKNIAFTSHIELPVLKPDGWKPVLLIVKGKTKK